MKYELNFLLPLLNPYIHWWPITGSSFHHQIYTTVAGNCCCCQESKQYLRVSINVSKERRPDLVAVDTFSSSLSESRLLTRVSLLTCVWVLQSGFLWTCVGLNTTVFCTLVSEEKTQESERASHQVSKGEAPFSSNNNNDTGILRLLLHYLCISWLACDSDHHYTLD